MKKEIMLYRTYTHRTKKRKVIKTRVVIYGAEAAAELERLNAARQATDGEQGKNAISSQKEKNMI